MVTEHKKVCEDLIALLDPSLEWLAYLHARWQDEREYEDWSEYARAIINRFQGIPEARLTVTAVHQRPFGFNFTTGEIHGQIWIKSARGAANICYRMFPGMGYRFTEKP